MEGKKGSAISNAKDYQAFRRNVALQKVIVEQGQDQKIWKFYDFGPKKVRSPLICIPGSSGSAECYFRQVYGLGTQGYRVITVEYPEYWSHTAWCDGFTKFLDQLNVDKVHLLGGALGGYLCQLYAQYRGKRVESLILINTYVDTSHFKSNRPFFGFTRIVPEFMLKRTVLSNFNQDQVEQSVADSIDFMVEQLEKLSQSQVASRLKLNSLSTELQPNFIAGKDRVTIIDVLDDADSSQKLRDEMYKYYPEAKIALLKSGGSFCYLSRSDEVNMHIKIHFRPYIESKYTPYYEEKTDKE